MQPQDTKQTPIKIVPTKCEMKELTIFLVEGRDLYFIGRYLPEKQKENWHYYIDDKSTIYHVRKEHMIAVIERTIK